MKALESPWKPDDRSGVWLKMKPDYTEQAEIDAVIIAAYYGAGRRGGQVGAGGQALIKAQVHGTLPVQCVQQGQWCCAQAKRNLRS